MSPVSGSNRKARRRRRITELYGSICHICGKPIEPDAHGNDALTIDHLVPRSKGGRSGLHNVRLAHRGCNEARGNRPLIDPAPPDDEVPHWQEAT